MKTTQRLINIFFKKGKQGIELFNRFYKNRRIMFAGVDFTRANFKGANFTGANFKGVDFTGVKINEKFKITKFKIMTGLYKYPVFCFILNKKIPLLRMGCYIRTIQQWSTDFWNNKNEFKNDNSKKSNDRLFAFEVAKLWFNKNN